MTSESFFFVLGVFCSLYLYWGFRVLPRAQWQILAAVPIRRSSEGPWHGVNLTWYGVLSANAYVVAVVIFLLLTGSLALSRGCLVLFVAGLLALCIPASRLVARLVEKKAHTLTVGGAVFVGLLASPLVLETINIFSDGPSGRPLPFLPVLAAMSIAYAFGEGLGRLACLSFGCCYGKPLAESPVWLQRLCGRFAVRFFGETKKIAYASDLEGERVLPVQGMTAVLCVVTGVVCSNLFLSGHYAVAFVLSVSVTQLWRVMSELLRADFRGAGRLTAYQWMGLLACPYSLLLALFTRYEVLPSPVLTQGLAQLWSPGMLLLLQGLWLLVLLVTGRSEVTGATLSFHVHQERI